MGSKPKPGKVRAEVNEKPPGIYPYYRDDTRYMRVRIRKEVLMEPSLYVGDVVVIDKLRHVQIAEQGQIVAVEAWEIRANEEPGKLPQRDFFTTFRRRYNFAGVELFVIEQTGSIPYCMGYRLHWPVVAIETDEISGHALAPRPDEVEARLNGARWALRSLSSTSSMLTDGAGRVKDAATREKAIKHAEKFIDIGVKMVRQTQKLWEHPKAGKLLKRLQFAFCR